MPYIFYLGDVQLPIAPSKLQTKIKNQNKTVTLINEGEINILKQPGLTEIDFDFEIPHTAYPFASYPDGFKPIKYYLDHLEKLKKGLKPFIFKCVRMNQKNELLFYTNVSVSLEDYPVVEDAKNGLDVTIKVKLKQYRDYGTKSVSVAQVQSDTPIATIETTRETGNAPDEATYTVQPGDSLWNIAKKQLGDGSRYNEIYALNKDKIRTPNEIQTGAVLVLPTG